MTNIEKIVQTRPDLDDVEFVPPEGYDRLMQMFDWQQRLGNLCFSKNDVRDNDGKVLCFDKIFTEFAEGKFGPNNLPAEWLTKFIECMQKELDEADELIPWKHWSKEQIGQKAYPDKTPEERLEMLRIELIDVWHFLMSALMCVGIGPSELADRYIAKNKVNIERQMKDYNTAFKNEDDNLKLAKDMAGN